MALSRPGAPLKHRGAPLSTPACAGNRSRSALGLRFSGLHCRVLNVNAVERTLQREDLVDGRVGVEVAYARTKVQDVRELTRSAKGKFDELLALFPASPARVVEVPPEPTVVVHKRLDWGANAGSEVFVKTTRESSSPRARRSVPTASRQKQPKQPALSYLAQEGQRILTADEEKELAVKVQQYVRLEDMRRHFDEVHGRTPTWEELGRILEADAVDLEKEYRNGYEAKQTMITYNMRLVISIAVKLREPGSQLTDLVVDGVGGLIRAVEKFDPQKGTKLSTYAHWWIRQSIKRCMQEKNRVVRVPSNVAEEYHKMIKARDRHVEVHGVVPSDEALAKKLGLTLKRFATVKNAYKRAISLDEPLSLGDGNSETRGDAIEDEKIESAEEHYVRKTMRQDLDLVLSTLPEKEATILRLRYGLEDGNERTLEDIGRLFHVAVTRERVRQIEVKALRKLRQRSGSLKEYLEPMQQTLCRSAGSAHLKAR